MTDKDSKKAQLAADKILESINSNTGKTFKERCQQEIEKNRTKWRNRLINKDV